MAYSAEISRTNPACFIFLVDRSLSMMDPWGAKKGAEGKDQGVADAINGLLRNLVIRSSKAEGVRDYYHIGVIAYGEDVGPALGGPLAGRALVPVSEVADNPARIETRTQRVEAAAPTTCPTCGATIGCPTCGAKIEAPAGEVVENEVQFPVWLEPEAKGATPMCRALAQAGSVVKEFLEQYPKSFPPIVINITDGEATDGNPTNGARALRDMKSRDGNVLLFNLHISRHEAASVLYPDSPEGLVDDYARLLFEMSSVLPDYMRGFAVEEGLPVSPGSRGFAFNADMTSVVNFLDIGTRPANLR